MDNDLGRTDGNGIRLIIHQVVFSQIDSVGVTAAWAEGQKVTQRSFWLNPLKISAKYEKHFTLKTAKSKCRHPYPMQ